MRVLLDLDDTLVDLVPKWVYYYNKRFGKDLTVEDIQDWELPGLWENWESILMEPDFFRDLPWVYHPHQGERTQEIVRSLTYDHDIRIVTSAVSGEAAKGKYMWVHTNLVVPGILDSMDKLIITRDKSVVKGDVLIDDKPDYLRSFEGTGIAFARPWNEGYEGPRATHWGQVRYYLTQIREFGRKGYESEWWGEGSKGGAIRSATCSPVVGDRSPLWKGSKEVRGS